ncbi:MAG: hypothetical protein IJA10_09825 [Lachnospiraceae bacterium]|nr:hypothetical protein [Lachnospiraceae bacterium]
MLRLKKKRIIKAGSIALGITTLMGIINYILGTMFEKIIGIRFRGGEVSNTYGFGIELEKLYPEYSIANPIESHITIHVAPINFILTVVMLSVVIYFILTCGDTKH